MYRKLLEAHLKLVKEGQFGKPMAAFDVETDGLHGPITITAMTDGTMELYGGAENVLNMWPERNPMIAVHNGKYDIRQVVKACGVLPRAMWLDTMAAVWLLHEEEKRLGLKTVVPKFLNVDDPVWEKGWDASMTQDELKRYLSDDINYTRQLMLWAWPRLEREGLLHNFLKIESPMMFLAAEMEDKGIRIDRTRLEELWQHSRVRISELKQEMQSAVPEFQWNCERCEGTGKYTWKRGNKVSDCRDCEGSGANGRVWNSPTQLSDLLFGTLGLSSVLSTDKGNPSTGHDALVLLRRGSKDQKVTGFLDLLLEFREQEKLYSGFYNPYMEAGSERLHPSWKPWGTKTGRWSCSEPNLMQVPQEIRSLFLPDEGHVFVGGDYVQLEMYIAGVLSQEKAILDAYENGTDLHSRTADAAGRDRSVGKTINFALLYGLSPSSLADRLAVDLPTAVALKEQVLGEFSSLHTWIKQQKRDCKDRGYVTTILGRKRRIPEISSPNPSIRARAENQSVNTPVQGSAADLMKCAQLYCRTAIPEAVPVLQVHDELVSMCLLEDAETVREAVQDCMENALPTKLRPRADVNIMHRWSK